jgi:hypothetical protein
MTFRDHRIKGHDIYEINVSFACKPPMSGLVEDSSENVDEHRFKFIGMNVWLG